MLIYLYRIKKSSDSRIKLLIYQIMRYMLLKADQTWCYFKEMSIKTMCKLQRLRYDPSENVR